MADRLRAQVAAAPHDLLIVLTGNFHTRLKPRGSYAYMGSVLSQGNPALRVAALDRYLLPGRFCYRNRHRHRWFLSLAEVHVEDLLA
jgi:hypothetical protein